MMYEPTAVIWRSDTVTTTILAAYSWIFVRGVALDFRRGAAAGDAVGQFRRQAEFDGLLPAGQFADLDRTEPAQGVDHVFHQDLRRRGACGDADDLGVVEPLGLDLAAVGDQVARCAVLLA